MRPRLIPILALLSLVLHPATLQARGGGGCLQRGTPVLTPHGMVPVEQLGKGDPVVAVSRGVLCTAEVAAVATVEPDAYYEVAAAGRVLHLTGAHPVETAPGVFQTAESLKAGGTVCVSDGAAIRTATIDSVARTPSAVPAFNLLVASAGTYIAGGIVVHNKGCFLPETPILLEDGRANPISTLKPGDRVQAFTPEGRMVGASILRVLIHEVDAYCVVTTETRVLHVTAEHPFYVGNGVFKTLETLKAGDDIVIFDGRGLAAQRIVAIQIIRAGVRVYNLQTDAPNTFFADGVAVHNKGGGCFMPDTLVRKDDGTESPISVIRPGDRVLAFTPDGRMASACVRQILAHRVDNYRIVRAGGSVLKVTADHPFYVGNGAFNAIGALRAGTSLYAFDGRGLEPSLIESIETAERPATVFNLQTDAPNTFFANGVAVHNKGGGSHHSSGGSRSSSRGGTASNEPPPPAFLVLFGLIVLGVIIAAVKGQKSAGSGKELDFIFSPAQVSKKAEKTKKILEFLARQDPDMKPETLVQQASRTFLTLQQCWQARDYGPMKPLMMTDLYADHCRQIQGMIRNHEINLIEGVRIDRVDLVNVRYPFKQNQREFTALITATAKDYYVDDRTRERMRGDIRPAQFQEFWTFQRQDSAWLLRDIEQTGESDALKEDNFFEQFTDTGVDQIYGAAAGKDGSAGPWLEKEAGTKDTRIERLLNFLVQTDKLWTRQTMLETSRRLFLELMAAWESGDPAAVPDADLFPELAADLRKQIAVSRAQGLAMEFRNLCVRKVELVLVQNFDDDARDEFVVRIRAHAQKVMLRQNEMIGKDEDVRAFEQYLTLGRVDKTWKLKEILNPADAQELVARENLDQDSNAQQLQWYYQHKRAV